ncbi:MAG: flavin reductase family protein [Actinobacteria bacterium]|nr:flavin reductase family protein [Actinomycetota bacterium]
MSEHPADATEKVYESGEKEFRTVMGRFATGITIITAIDNDEPVGVAANSFTSVSLEPPLVLFCVARTSSTWPRIEKGRKFAVNILGEHQEEVSGLFASKNVDRFADIDWHRGQGGSPVLHDTIGYLDCEFWAEYDGGDHIIVVGKVVDLGINREVNPLLYYGGAYHRLHSPDS